MREYATQMEAAKQGIITPEMKTVAEKEFTDPEIIRERVALGQIAIPANINHKSCVQRVLARAAHQNQCKFRDLWRRQQLRGRDGQGPYGPAIWSRAIMDVHYGKTNTFRQQLIELSPAMIGTVPMYDAIGYLEKDLLDITAQDFQGCPGPRGRRGGFHDHPRWNQSPGRGGF